MIADILTLLGTQATALTGGVVDALEIVVPILIGMVLFYFAWKKLRGAVK